MLSEQNRALVERVAPSRAEQSIARLYPELLNRLLDAAYAAGRAEVWEEVEPALEPFAKAARLLDDGVPPDDMAGDDMSIEATMWEDEQPKVGDLRRAAKLHAKLTASDPT